MRIGEVFALTWDDIDLDNRIIKINKTVYAKDKEANGRYIKYHYIKGNIGKIVNDIAIGNIYLKHLPETYELGRHKNAGDFIMITAGFEWELRRKYPD